MNPELFEYFFGISETKIPASVIITPFFSHKRLQEFCKITSEFKGKAYSGAICAHNGKNFAVVTSGLGPGLAGDSVILLGRAGAKRVIFAGSCGGLNSADIGDVIICGEAFGGEGFSGYHAGINGFKDVLSRSGMVVRPDEALSRVLEARIKKLAGPSVTVRTGKVFTIGSLTAETKENMEELARRKYSCVEMEVSAVIRAAESVKVSSAAILFVSDTPSFKPFWKDMEKEDKRKYNDSIGLVFRACVDVLAG